MDSYYTLAHRGESEFVEKRSRFLGFAFPISSVDQALVLVGVLRRKYYDARHVCWAYRLGPDGEVFRANDDGEPGGSAGKPILGRLVAEDISDALVAVVRYFGGVKLGPSGLIAAYRMAAAEALAATSRLEVILKCKVEALFGYELMGDVMRIVKDSDAEVEEQDFRETCRLQLAIRHGSVDSLLSKLSALYGVTVKAVSQSDISGNQGLTSELP